MSILCINMDFRPDRWAETQKAMAKTMPGFLPLLKRFPAVVGVEAVREADSYSEITFLSKHFGPYGMVGCALSHIRCWQEVVRHPEVPWTLVLEDDCDFTPPYAEEAIRSAIQLALSLTATWDICYVGWNALRVCKPYIEQLTDVTQEGYSLVKPLFPLNLHCYLLTPQSAARLLLKHHKIYNHVDFELFLKQRMGIVDAVALWHIERGSRSIWQRELAEAASDISHVDHPKWLLSLLQTAGGDEWIRTLLVKVARIGSFNITPLILTFLLGITAIFSFVRNPVLAAIFVFAMLFATWGHEYCQGGEGARGEIVVLLVFAFVILFWKLHSSAFFSSL